MGSWTFPWSILVPGYPPPEKPLDAFDILVLANNLGAGIVQYADNLPLHELAQTELADLRKQADNFGIAIEVGTRGIQTELLLQYLEIAKTLGAELVRTLLFDKTGKLSIPEIIPLLNRVLPEFKKENVVLAIENYQLYTTAEYRTIIESVGSGHLGICLDTINNLGTLETPLQVVQQLGEFAVNLHFKDFAIHRIATTLGYKIEGTPASKGALDARWLLETIGAYGICKSVIIEQWVPFSDSLESTRKRELEWAREGMRSLGDTMRDLGILEE
ncbi:MAG: TIM barrel protein [Spirochaetaceae bacterium]|nr:MAG: TIM barrel protein [Spirochaetaceae bacterium]